MTGTATRTAAFTITHARYVGAKIGADLRLLNGLYGKPPLAWVDDFAAARRPRCGSQSDSGRRNGSAAELRTRLWRCVSH